MELDHLNKSILNNYRELRRRIGLLALAFPLVVVGIGAVWRTGLQPTLSHYYFAPNPVKDAVDGFPVRLWFCGILFVVGFFLFKYKGFSKNEDRWLGLAGIFALGVAIFPMPVDGRSDFDPLAFLGISILTTHGVCAVLAFACIGIVILWYSHSTLSRLKEAEPDAYRWYLIVYRIIGWFMVVSIGAAVFMHYAFDQKGSWILVAEWAGVWAFAAYWFVKNSELDLLAKVLAAPKIEASVARAA